MDPSELMEEEARKDRVMMLGRIAIRLVHSLPRDTIIDPSELMEEEARKDRVMMLARSLWWYGVKTTPEECRLLAVKLVDDGWTIR